MILSELLISALLPIPWNHQKNYRFWTGIKFFLLTILAKYSILDVCQGSKCTSEYCYKILAKWLLMSIGKHQNKGVYWYEKGFTLSTHSCLHCSQFPFILIFQAQRHSFSFSSLYFIIHLIGTTIAKNKCCVFLASMLNSFCFIVNALSVSSNSHQ